MLFFNANFICYYFYPTKKREEPEFFLCLSVHLFESFPGSAMNPRFFYTVL